jgi:hypothetical protein
VSSQKLRRLMLGGLQTDFSRNCAREGKALFDAVGEVVACVTRSLSRWLSRAFTPEISVASALPWDAHHRRQHDDHGGLRGRDLNPDSGLGLARRGSRHGWG